MPRISVSSFIFAAATLLLAGGCGGSGGGGSHSTGSDFSGAYLGSANLQTGFQGALDFTVTSDGSTVGNLVVTATSSQTSRSRDGGSSFPPGTYSVNGTTSNLGVLSLQGTASGTPFTIGGNVPVGSGAEGFVITIDGTTFAGSVHKDTGSSSAEADVTFSDASSSNAHTDHFPTGAVTPFVDPGDPETLVWVKDSTGRTVTVNVPNTVQVGDTYTFDSLHRFATYFEPDPSDTLFSNTWAADGGSFTLVAKNGNHFSIILNNVHYTAVVGFGHAEGSLVLNGTFHN